MIKENHSITSPDITPTINHLAVNQKLMNDHIGISFEGFNPTDENTRAFLEGGAKGMVRRLCPIATLATVINTTRNERIIDGKDAPIPLGDLLREIASYHMMPGLIGDTQPEWQPTDEWQVFDGLGRIRYHAVAAAAEAFDVPTAIVEEFPLAHAVKLLKNGAKAGVSVSNRFVDLSNPKVSDLEEGGHIIPLITVRGQSTDILQRTITTADPYADTNGLAGLTLPLSVLAEYLPRDPNTQKPFIKGIIFAANADQLGPLRKYQPSNAITPHKVTAGLREWVSRRL
jgi:hypothetical protein